MAALRLFWNVASLNCRSRTDFTSPFTFIQNWLNFVKESSQTELRSRQANFHNVAVVRWVTEHFFGPRKNRFLCLSLSRTHKQLPSLFLCLFSSSFLSLSLPPSPTHLWRSNNLSHTRIHNRQTHTHNTKNPLAVFLPSTQQPRLCARPARAAVMKSRGWDLR